MLLVTVSVPLLLDAAARSGCVVAETVLLVTVNVPSLKIPPPLVAQSRLQGGLVDAEVAGRINIE